MSGLVSGGGSGRRTLGGTRTVTGDYQFVALLFALP